MDLSKLMGMFGLDAAEMPDPAGDPLIQEIMQDPEMQNELVQVMEDPALTALFSKVNGIFTQGGIMPDDADSIMEQLGSMDGVLAGINHLFDEIEYDEMDLDEEAAAYQPETEDAADRAFAAALKEWLKTALTEIPAEDVCMLEIGYHLGFTDETLAHPLGDIWLAYNTAETDAQNRTSDTEYWHFANWTDNYFRSLDSAPFEIWRKSQGYDLEEDDGDLTERVYDLAAVAVMELHSERFTEQRFGRKVPFIIADYEYYPKIAVRAVKANGGTELFDSTFFSDCGFSENDGKWTTAL